MSDTEAAAAPAEAEAVDPVEAKIAAAKHNMSGTPMALGGEPPPEAEEVLAGLAEEVEAVGKAVVQRYIPPDPPPTVIEQLEAMKNPPTPPEN